METYKRGSHTVWDCKYHLVWVTKYRYPVMLIHAGSINRDHVQMLLSIPPNLSVSARCSI